MNWEAIGAIGEIVGAGAVVISIVYLAIQIRSNARATRARASFDASHSWAQFNEQMSQAPDDVLALVLKTYGPTAKIEDLTDVEYMRMVAVHRTIFQKLEGQYFLFRYGSLESDVWENRRRVARGILDIPFYRAWSRSGWPSEMRKGPDGDPPPNPVKWICSGTPSEQRGRRTSGSQDRPGRSPNTAIRSRRELGAVLPRTLPSAQS